MNGLAPCGCRTTLLVGCGFALLLALGQGVVFAQQPPEPDPCVIHQHYIQTWDVSDNRAGAGVIEAWEIFPFFSGSGHRPVVLDTGVAELENPDLLMVINDADTSQLDHALRNGVQFSGELHSTAITGIIAAARNGIGIQGIAYGSTFIAGNADEPVPTGDGIQTKTEVVIDLIDELLSLSDQQTIAAVNNSWFPTEVEDSILVLAPLFQELAVPGQDGGRDGKGLPFVFAIGNNGLPVARGGTPIAATAGVIGVSNLGRNGVRFGDTSGPSNYGPWVSVSAPGDDLLTTGLLDGCDPDCVGTGPIDDPLLQSGCELESDELLFLTSFGGTSSAAPVVTGVLTLMHEANDQLEGPQMERVLTHAARKINFTDRLAYSPLVGFSDSYGFGLVDAEAAVEAAVNLDDGDGLSWPEPPSGLTAELVTGSVFLQWTNPDPPLKSHGVILEPRGEFAGAVVVRYDGNVWDQSVWPRTVATGLVDDSNELLWRMPDGTDPEEFPSLQVPPGISLEDVGTDDYHIDSTLDETAAATYAVFTYNEDFRYSVPAVVLKPSMYCCPISPDSHSLSSSNAVFVEDQSSDHALPYTISDVLGLEITEDGEGNTDTDSWGFWSLYGGAQSDISTGAEYLEMVFNLTAFETAALTFTEMLEVYGVGGVGSSSFQGQWALLLLTEVHENGDPVQSGIEREALFDHTSITFNRDTRQYDWRKQSFDLSDFAGKRVKVRWEIVNDGVPSLIIGDPADHIGWWIDAIEVRGEPVLPDCSDADFNNDGEVDGDDLAFLLANWGDCGDPQNCPADLNGDEVVDIIDQAMLLGVFGPCPQSIMAHPGWRDDATLTGSGQVDEWDNAWGGAVGGSSVPWILDELGFSSVSSYMYWLSNLSSQEIAAHIVQVIQMILNQE